MQKTLFSDTEVHDNKIKKFDELIAKGVDKREAEKIALTPDKLLKINIKGRSLELLNIIFYFNYESEVELVKEFFKVNEYLNLNVNKTDLLIRLLLGLKLGIIKESDLPCLKKSESLL